MKNGGIPGRKAMSKNYEMQHLPLISVIVPVYNAGRYVAECLDSIAKQSYANLEVVMINDGSSDDSGAVCERFAAGDHRFRLINTVNRGVSAARNLGIAEARGRYVMFVDADDMIHPSMLERLMEVAAESGSDITICSMYYGAEPRWPEKRGEVEIYLPERIVELGMYQKRMVNMPCAMLIEKAIFDTDASLRFRQGIRYEDLDFFYKLLLAARKVAYFRENLYFYRAHSESFINTFSPQRADMLDVTDEMLLYMQRRGDERLVKAARDRRFSAHYNMWLLLIAGGVEMPEIEARCLGVVKGERLAELANPHVRMKNKLGAIASYGGRRLVGFLMKMMKKDKV